MSGMIIGSKLKPDGKVTMEVLMDYEDAVQLQGHINDVHLFSEKISHLKMNISTRGKNGATKYILIPRDLRGNLNFEKPVNCQKIDLKDKMIFIYSIEKSS